jgi:hypothetical protein
MPNLTDKYRYQVFPDRIYFIRDEFGNTITVTGQQIVERFISGQKDKETERETSELNQA